MLLKVLTKCAHTVVEQEKLANYQQIQHDHVGLLFLEHRNGRRDIGAVNPENFEILRVNKKVYLLI